MKTKYIVLTKNIFIDECPKQSNENLQKRIIQVIMLLLILSVPVFAQVPDIPCDEDPDCVVLPDSETIGDPIDDPWDPWDDGWIDGGDPIDPFDGSGANGQACFDLNNEAPENCYTDPGNADDVDYSQWIADNLGRILGGLNVECPNNQGCIYPNNFPNIDTPMVQEIISLFASTFYQNYDYIDSRNDILDILIQSCNDNYWDNPGSKGAEMIFNLCINSQLDFFYSMAPLQGTSTSSWLSSVSIRIPWTGVSIGFGVSDDITPANWVEDLLAKVAEDRLCHSWYNALAAAGCNLPISP